ncbi:unnamed protein product [Calypogeia fissa]
MTTVGPAAFQARLKALVDSRKERTQLVEAETQIYNAKAKEHQEHQSKAQEFQQTGLKTYVKAEEVTREIKAIDGQRHAVTHSLDALASKERSLNEELYNLGRKRDENLKFYDCKEDEIRNFKLQLRDHELTIQRETTQARGQSHELKCDVQKVRQSATHSDSDVKGATETNERERTRLMSAKQAISRDVPLNHNTVGNLERQLYESLLLSGTKKRDLAAAVETLRAEITVLQTTERRLEDQVLQAISRRDKRKRELHDLECKLAQKKKLLYGNIDREIVSAKVQNPADALQKNL